MPVSLSIEDELGHQLYEDAADIPANLTIAQFRNYLKTVPYDKTWDETTDIFYVPSYYNIDSIKITKIENDAVVELNEETDKIGKFPFDEYIINVAVKRKPRAARKKKSKKVGGGRLSKTLRGRK